MSNHLPGELVVTREIAVTCVVEGCDRTYFEGLVTHPSLRDQFAAFIAKLMEYGWVADGVETWLCPKHAATALYPAKVEQVVEFFCGTDYADKRRERLEAAARKEAGHFQITATEGAPIFVTVPPPTCAAEGCEKPVTHHLWQPEVHLLVGYCEQCWKRAFAEKYDDVELTAGEEGQRPAPWRPEICRGCFRYTGHGKDGDITVVTCKRTDAIGGWDVRHLTGGPCAYSLKSGEGWKP
jgi:hypothetical protein